MGERVEWSDLPKELLPAIGKRLNTSIDVLRFRSTCNSWRSAIPPSVGHPSPFPRLVTTPCGQNCLTHTTIYRLQPSHATQNPSISSSSSSSKGWLVKVEGSNFGQLRLLDPLTNNCVSNSPKRYPLDTFPKVLDLMNFRVVELFKASHIMAGHSGWVFRPDDIRIRKVVLFPNSAQMELEDCMVFAIYQEGKLGFSKIGDEKWNLLDDKNFYYDDMAIHKGQLYVVDRWGTISWIDTLSMKLVQFSPPLCGLGKKKHLVECGGSLYVVDMHIEGDPHNRWGGYYEVADIKVYMLDEEWGRWLDVKNLGDHLFVLGKDCNFSLSAQDYYGCEGNCIYFSTNSSSFVFSLESYRFQSPKVFWPCPSLFDPKFSKLHEHGV